MVLGPDKKAQAAAQKRAAAEANGAQESEDSVAADDMSDAPVAES
jgi:hypothetical protein